MHSKLLYFCAPVHVFLPEAFDWETIVAPVAMADHMLLWAAQRYTGWCNIEPTTSKTLI